MNELKPAMGTIHMNGYGDFLRICVVLKIPVGEKNAEHMEVRFHSQRTCMCKIWYWNYPVVTSWERPECRYSRWINVSQCSDKEKLYCGIFVRLWKYYVSECVKIIHDIKHTQITIMPTQVIKLIRKKWEDMWHVEGEGMYIWGLERKPVWEATWRTWV